MNFFITSMKRGPIDKNWRTHTFGHFDNLERAKTAVKNNECNLQECYYDFCLIEGLEYGIHPINIDKKNNFWYSWNYHTNSWDYCECPPEFMNICNFALG